MSLLARLLGWTGMPQWLIELVAVGALALAGWGYFHWRLHEAAVHAVAARKVAERQASDQTERNADARIALLTKQHAAAAAAAVGALNAQYRDLAARRDADARRVRDLEAALHASSLLPGATGGPAAAIARGPGRDIGQTSFDRLASISIALADADRQLAAALMTCQRERDDLTGR